MIENRVRQSLHRQLSSFELGINATVTTLYRSKTRFETLLTETQVHSKRRRLRRHHNGLSDHRLFPTLCCDKLLIVLHSSTDFQPVSMLQYSPKWTLGHISV